MPSLTLTAPSIPASGRLPVLDELKGLAIILVILYHAGGALTWNNYLHGDLGVDIFVILSGLGLALSPNYTTAGDFLRRRLLRIFPTYWITLAAIVAINTWLLSTPPLLIDLLLHIPGIHGFFGDVHFFTISDSFWFITMIVYLYLAFIFVRRWLDQPDKLLFAGAILSIVPTMIWFFKGQSGSFGHFGLRIPGFFFGLLIGSLLRNGSLTIKLNLFAGIGLFLVTCVPFTQGVVYHTCVMGLALALLYTTVIHPRLHTPTANPRLARSLKFLGDHSLEIFLIHQPLIRNYNYVVHQRWLNEPTPSSWSVTAGMIVGLAVTIYLSWELRRLTNRIFAKKPASSS